MQHERNRNKSKYTQKMQSPLTAQDCVAGIRNGTEPKKLGRRLNLIKKALTFVGMIPIIFLSSIVIHFSGADRETWPSLEEIKAYETYE